MRAEIGSETFGENRIRNFKAMISGFEELAKEVCDMLLDGVFLDLNQYLQDLMTRKWYPYFFHIKFI